VIEPDLAARRMHGQRLWGRHWPSAGDAVGGLAAMQAQEFQVALWSVAQRTNRRANRAALARAFDEGRILRTHLMRPTWHFVTPNDIRWLLDLIGPRVHAANAHYYRVHGVEGEAVGRSNDALAEAVAGGRHPTRAELQRVLEGAGIEARGPRLAYFVMRAELDGVLCSGPMRGRQHTYAALDERAPNAIALHLDEALGELTRRYFTTRGPATVKDYARWSSLTLFQARRGLDLVGSELEHADLDGRTYWFAPGDPPEHIDEGRVDLVQGYDELVMSYSESRDALLGLGVPDEGPTLPFLHTLLLDGRVAGAWRPAIGRDSATVEATLLRPGKTGRPFVEAAVERYGQYLGLPTDLALV
jgi:hypothetical protein